jgi:3',5'-cyclic-AMP phosphodiesterase
VTVLAPDPERTLLAIGDTHWAVPGLTVGIKPMAPWRAESFADRVLSTTALLPLPVAVAHIGDITEEGRPEEYALATAWWDRFPGEKIACPGNHDIQSAYGTGLAEWEAAMGQPHMHSIETEHFAVVSVLWGGWQYGTSTNHASDQLNTALGKTQLKAMIDAAAPKPCALMFHYPPLNTVTGDTGKCLTAYGNDRLKELIAECPNLHVVLHGHTHTHPTWSWITSLGWGAGIEGVPGGRRASSQNLSATTYIGTLDWYAPLVGYYLTFLDDRLEVRIRDIQGRSWIPRYFGRPRVEVWEYQ